MDSIHSSFPTRQSRTTGNPAGWGDSAVLPGVRSAFDTHQELPLRRRLSLLLALCAGATALCGFVAVLIVGVAFQQARALHASQEIARTMAYALQAPLAFEDRKAIADTLGGLSTRTQVEAAWLLDKSGRLVAAYGDAGDDAPVAGGGLHSGSLVVSEAVWAGKAQLGRVVLRNGLNDLYQALAFELAAILLGCGAGLLLSLKLARRVARRITEPVSALAVTAGAIAADKDYSKRLRGEGGDEIGLAVDAFNRMLDEVQARDLALAESMRTLERRVTGRTQELKREKEVAEDASRAKSRFVANLGKELRTELSALVDVAQQLDQGDANNGRRQLLDAIRGGGVKLLGLIDDVLDLSCIEGGAFELAVADFDLLDCVQGALATAAVASRAKEVQLAGVFDPSLNAWRRGDANRMRQVLLTLLRDAVERTPHGEVVLRVVPGTAPDSLHISVADTGIGVGQAWSGQVFEPFHRAGDGTLPRCCGSPLELAISRRLVEAMGGRIEVSSEPGKGSCFDIWMQLAPAGRAGNEPPPLNQSVAFFEPHDPSAQALAAQLVRLGCNAQRCHTPQELQTWLERLGDTAQKPWLLVAVDQDQGWQFLESSAAWLDPQRVVGMSDAESPATQSAPDPDNLPPSLTKPVLRAALVSRLGAPARNGAAQDAQDCASAVVAG